ncbi:hypothetical protein ACFWNL_18340 [Kitasatospora sp. NPDC058397]|uniref:hypothetical protein n=1 Tax=unclassified Kitasatospora TaxID=2633591 RepID=UPI003663AFAB
MSAETAAADALVRKVEQHMSGPLGGSTASNSAWLTGGQSPQQGSSSPGGSGTSGGGRG